MTETSVPYHIIFQSSPDSSVREGNRYSAQSAFRIVCENWSKQNAHLQRCDRTSRHSAPLPSGPISYRFKSVRPNVRKADAVILTDICGENHGKPRGLSKAHMCGSVAIVYARPYIVCRNDIQLV